MMETTFNGKIITRNDMLGAMHVFDKEWRPTYPEWKWKVYAVVHEGKNYPPKDLLRIAAGTDEVPGGGRPVNIHFERLGFEIATLGESLPDAGDVDTNAAIDASLSLERDLEKFLLQHLSELEPGLKPCRESAVAGSQVGLATAGRLDVLARGADGALVVIEIKAGEATDSVCGQILRYMGWVQEHLSANDEKVRGIVVANDFSERLRLAARAMPNVTLKRYAVRFSFEDI
jgi:hypothetical protein